MHFIVTCILIVGSHPACAKPAAQIPWCQHRREQSQDGLVLPKKTFLAR